MFTFWKDYRDNYAPDKIGLVTLPQKVNKEKNRWVTIQYSGSGITEICRALYFGFTKSKLARLVFNGFGDMKKRIWLKI